MRALVTIDPGLRGTGVAIWLDGKLVNAAYVESAEQKRRGPVAWVAMAAAVEDHVWEHMDNEEEDCAHELVMEVPQIYGPEISKADPDDLLQLAGVDGAIARALRFGCPVVGYRPREWKGQTPKAIHNRRVENALSLAELDTFQRCPSHLRHNILDAVGIGLFHLGRLGGLLGKLGA